MYACMCVCVCVLGGVVYACQPVPASWQLAVDGTPRFIWDVESVCVCTQGVAGERRKRHVSCVCTVKMHVRHCDEMRSGMAWVFGPCGISN